MTLRFSVVSLALCGLICGCGVVQSLALRPSHTIARTPAAFSYTYDEKTVPLDDGETMSLWHVHTTQATRKGVLVIVPGSDSNKSRYVIGLPIFVDDGWDVVLMDYEGFGQSTGKPTFDGIIRSTKAAYDYAASQSDTVVGYSISLGTAALARVAAERGFKACIFDGTIDLYDEASLFMDHLHLGSPLFLLVDGFVALDVPKDFDIKTWITKVTAPKLFIQSPDDNVTPYVGAFAVFQAAPPPKHFFVTQGDHIAQVFLDPGLYRAVVNGWLTGVLNQDPILNAEFQQLYQTEILQSLELLGAPPEA